MTNRANPAACRCADCACTPCVCAPCRCGSDCKCGEACACPAPTPQSAQPAR